MSIDIHLPKNSKEQFTPNSYLSDNTKFKIVAYWNVKPNGQYWSIIEKNMKQHRKYIDSFDYHVTSEGRTVTRHDEAFYKLLVYAQKNVSRAEKILIYMNDFYREEQYLIGKFVSDETQCNWIAPIFETDSLGVGHVYANRLPVEPLASSKLIQRALTKKPKTILDYAA